MEQSKQLDEQALLGITENSTKTRVLNLTGAIDEISSLLISEYKLDTAAAAKIIENDIKPFFNHLKPELHVVIEMPYVDKLYRDSYYIFYASKHYQHYRDSMRLSFFDTSIEETDFLNRRIYEDKLKKRYVGFLVIRPTFTNVIGRTAISPVALKQNNFVCCHTSLDATVLSNKFNVLAFPHSSQDGHTITCAETTIWGIMEYFAYQYAEYKPVLPSTISQIIQKISFKRTFPSEGLTAEQVTYAIRELGFSPMIYSRKKHSAVFNSLASIYIESGIPLIGVLKNSKGNIGHAVNIIGREQEDLEKIAQTPPHEETSQGGFLIDFNQIDRKYVYMDDNFPPYQLGSLNYPCQDYFIDEEKKVKWHDVNLTHIIVPLYSKIYLDAAKAKRNFMQALNSQGLGEKISINITDTRILRVFLASSRSFKEYISLDSDLPEIAKSMVLATPMPKFIWLAEISKPDSFIQGMCDGILVQDATEPGEFTGKKSPLMHSLILGIYEKVIFRQDFGKFKALKATFAGPFKSYRKNLKSVTYDSI
jgi:hypothetical protein